MDLNDISRLRLISQQIETTKFNSPKEIVNWMGAMQAQDYNMVKWAIGVRLPDYNEKQIEAAIDRGDIIRTHLMRPTWHLVSNEDIYWMLDLTAPRIKAFMKSRNNQLGLTDAIFAKSNNVIVKSLAGNKNLTRDELIAELNKVNIDTSDYKSSHLIMQAELDGLICSGDLKNKKITYALLSERVPKKLILTKEESLYKIACKYFSSHYPATLQDFIWWSGLLITDARKAIDLIKNDFISEKINEQIYWFPNSISIPPKVKDKVYLLPAFDEFLISYKDRTASLPFENHIKTVSNNGIFRPVIVLNGKVIGVWKKTTQKNNIHIEPNYFQEPNITTKKLVEEAFVKYKLFMNKKAATLSNSSLKIVKKL